jgi:hypothetical protein
MTETTNGNIDFNFTPEQQERFNILWKETKKNHPNLTNDLVLKEKTKVVLAHFIINKEVKNNEVFTEIRE